MFCFTADQIPSGIEISTVSNMETAVSKSVAGSLETKVENTGLFET